MILLYIDPGTGAMLFTVLMGVISTGIYALRDHIVKIKFYLTGGNAEIDNESRNSFVIFSDDKRYWNVFEPICDEFEKRGEHISYFTSSEDDPALSKEYEYVERLFIGEGNRAYGKLNTVSADIVLSTTPSLDVFYWKRSNKVKWYVHIAHAPSDLTMYRMFGIDFYDAILVSGDYQERQIRQLEEARKIPEKEIVKVGLTYMDKMKEKVASLDTQGKSGVTVLLAPSWGDSAIFSRFGKSIIETLKKTGYHLIIRPHPQSFKSEKNMLDALMNEFPGDESLEWSTDNSNLRVLSRADILISDFSGVIFEYALLFNKPVIYTNEGFDPAPYDMCWLDDEPWTFKTLPNIGRELKMDGLDNLKTLIDECLCNSDYVDNIGKAREETWAYVGEGAKRTVDYLVDKRKELEDVVVQ